ncbi:MAG: hypothetical protein WC635_06590 [Bacteriovorax sp.]|jgi:hypothetical protein
MKKIFITAMLITSWSSFASTSFYATLINNGNYLSIDISDQQLIPPFEAGELWKVIKGSEQFKIIREKELEVNCTAITNPNNGDTVGRCKLLMPLDQFVKIGKYLVFKGEGQVAARLNRHFIDSAYFSAQGNQAYLSSYNTRRLFYFGINEDLIQR